ncbi:hypothetical protein K402DRAFT_391369 [Aulographum hederae CBS 113979]|uniref:Uncharacterized protein n=1 Tax=Aulographum hederae CBS 113979 TaxID=1176131 RepID=A0A6G1H831_9PEZI|nr:hypothetical protein K402DRAFT_391369 [Aulographum hederae CBS 113979]
MAAKSSGRQPDLGSSNVPPSNTFKAAARKPCSKSSSKPSKRPDKPLKRKLQSDTQRTPKRQKTKAAKRLAKFEQLPAEIIQAIFLESMNADLPLASPQLKYLLTSEHLFIEYTRRVHGIDHEKYPNRYLRGQDVAQNTDEWYAEHNNSHASRLVACRFFTALFVDTLTSKISEPFYLKGPLRLPEKVFMDSWTCDGQRLAEFFFGCEGHYIDDLGREAAVQGVFGALREGSIQALGNMQELGRVKTTTEMLQFAVLECEYDKGVISFLSDNPSPTLDALDLTLWRWADERKKDGDENGEHLMDELRSLNECLDIMRSIVQY